MTFEARGGSMKVMGYAEFDTATSAENAMSLVKVQPLILLHSSHMAYSSEDLCCWGPLFWSSHTELVYGPS